MTETHINAYFAAVDEAKIKVQLAKGELEAAELALETKKKEVGYAGIDEPEAEITETVQTREDEQPEPADEPENVNRHTVFQRKK